MKVFITGGTSGIGLALAKKYLNGGAQVAICGRDLSKVPNDVKNNKNIFFYELDVTDREAVKKTVKDFAGKELDIMIANAGRSVGSKTKTPGFPVSQDLIRVNTIGVLNTFEAALEIMLPNKKGHLVAISSVAGFVGLPGASSYSASKAAVLKICESYAIDLKEFNIDVTAIAPGFIDTPLTQQNDHAMPFMLDVQTAAAKIVKAIENKKPLYVFPWQMKIVIGLLDKMPRALYRKLMGLKMLNYSKEDQK